MGALARAFERRDTTYQQVFRSDSDNPAMDFSGRRVTQDSALGLSAVFACVRFIVDAVSTLPVHSLATGKTPPWLEQPIPRDPNTTDVVHLQQVVSSLMLEGNAFILVSPSIFNPAELRVLDPRTVEIKRGPGGAALYEVRDYRGGVVETLKWDQLIHIPLIRLPGDLRGISPLEAERQTFSSAIAAEALSANFLRNGTWLSAVVETPQGVEINPEDAKQLIRDIEAKYTGTRNAGKVGMLTQGATLKLLSVTPEQAQFLETRMYDDERILRIYRLPPALAGMIREGATSNASSVSQDKYVEKWTVRPLVRLLASGYSRIEPVKFRTKGLLEGDPKTQAEIYHFGLGDQWMAKEEIRELEDLPQRPDMTGLLQTPNNNAPGVAA